LIPHVMGAAEEEPAEEIPFERRQKEIRHPRRTAAVEPPSSLPWNGRPICVEYAAGTTGAGFGRAQGWRTPRSTRVSFRQACLTPRNLRLNQIPSSR
jgi:hypothetical protein